MKKLIERDPASDFKYTFHIHSEIKTRVQNVLNYGLTLAESKHLTEDKILTGLLPDGMQVRITNSYMLESIGYLEVAWGADEMRIQYDPKTRKIADSAKWKNREYQGVGHIQTYYSRELADDRMFDFDVVGLLQQVKDWLVVPRPIRTR